MEQHRLMKKGPKPSGCPLMVLKAAAVVAPALLTIWLVLS
jgi:hypothetical protein